MGQQLRNGNAERVFCGEAAMAPDIPCDREDAVEEREILKTIDFAKKKIAQKFRDSERFQEKIEQTALELLYSLTEPLGRRTINSAVIKVGMWNKATLRRNKGSISVVRTEKIEEEADDEEEIEE